MSILLQQDYIGGVFEDDYRIVYLYDGEDMITTSTVQQSDGIGGFDDYSRNIFTYDGSHFLIVNTLQYYDGVVWEDYSKTENDNNAEGLPDVMLFPIGTERSGSQTSVLPTLMKPTIIQELLIRFRMTS